MRGLALLLLLASGPLLAQELLPIPQPSAGMVDDTARKQLAEAHAMVADLEGADAGRRAAAFGELGELYGAYGLFDAARAAFHNARVLQPTARSAYLLGWAETQRGDLEAAAAAFEAATAADPQDAAAWQRLGEARLGLDDASAAQAAFEKALALDTVNAGGNAAAHAGIARARVAAGDDAGAVTAFERALALQPGASRLRYPLAQALRRLGRIEDAKAQLAQRGDAPAAFADPVVQAVQGRASGGAFLRFQADQAVLGGDFATAEALYRRTIEADPENYDHHKSLGLTIARLGRNEEAVGVLLQALELDPGEYRRASEKALIHFTIASLAFNRGALDAVIEHAGMVFTYDPEHVGAYVLMGNAFGRQGKAAEALRSFDKALEFEPDHLQALLQRSTTLMDLGRFGEAVPSLERRLALEPGNQHVARLLQIARERSGG